jgi:hypothetical protein
MNASTMRYNWMRTMCYKMCSEAMLAEYADFGDVVTFDTTYQTNIYRMSLAIFVSSNHQLQNVIFRQALLNNEQADTFKWLFKTFQNCMRPAKDPKCILTGNNLTCSKKFSLL